MWRLSRSPLVHSSASPFLSLCDTGLVCPREGVRRLQRVRVSVGKCCQTTKQHVTANTVWDKTRERVRELVGMDCRIW